MADAKQRVIDETREKIRREHPLATMEGLELFVSALFYTGAMCPKCGFGTRVKSKKWAECKKCGGRVERRKLPESNPQGVESGPLEDDYGAISESPKVP